MGTLRDEAYEQLDYLSQLTEVVVAPHNELLALLPDKVELSYNEVVALMRSGWSMGQQTAVLYMSDWLNNYVQNLKDNTPHIDRVTQIRQCFTFFASPDFEIDVNKQVMTGTVSVVKNSNNIEDKILLKWAANEACGMLASVDWPTKGLKERVVTVLNTLEDGAGTAWIATVEGRVVSQSRHKIIELFTSNITDNKWRIRDYSTIVQVGKWINSYLSDSDGGLGLVHLLKLKIMVNKDLPIYSVEKVLNDHST